jgi:hypothetical protein
MRAFLAASGAVLVACLSCGGSTSSSSGSCSLAAGTYVEHFMLQGNAAGCGNVPDQTLTLGSPETLTGGTTTTTSGTADGGVECSVTEDPSTCTVSTSCKATEGGFTSVITTTLTLGDGTASGRETIDSTDPTGGASCTYDFTVSKS